METIFVSDGRTDRDISGVGDAANVAKLREISAYLYAGWEYNHYGTAPVHSSLSGFTGFYFTRVSDASGPGFGSGPLLDRLRSGLHFGIVVEPDPFAGLDVPCDDHGSEG